MLDSRQVDSDDMKGQITLAAVFLGCFALSYLIQYCMYRLKESATCAHCHKTSQTWMVKCGYVHCTKVFCWSCSWQTMETTNDHFDPEEAGRISFCLSHLQRGQVTIETITGAQYPKESYGKMPKPRPIRRSTRIASRQSRSLQLVIDKTALPLAFLKRRTH
jgi:hypothetical protein